METEKEKEMKSKLNAYEICLNDVAKKFKLIRTKLAESIELLDSINK